MGLKAKLQKLEKEQMAEKKNSNKTTSKMTWLEQAYSKEARFVSSKVYSK